MFKIGDKVKCIDDIGCGGPRGKPNLTKNNIYTIARLYGTTKVELYEVQRVIFYSKRFVLEGIDNSFVQANELSGYKIGDNVLINCSRKPELDGKIGEIIGIFPNRQWPFTIKLFIYPNGLMTTGFNSYEFIQAKNNLTEIIKEKHLCNCPRFGPLSVSAIGCKCGGI